MAATGSRGSSGGSGNGRAGSAGRGARSTVHHTFGRRRMNHSVSRSRPQLHSPTAAAMPPLESSQRSSQLDALLLDSELTSMLLDQAKSACSLHPAAHAACSSWAPELRAAVGALVWAATVWRGGDTPVRACVGGAQARRQLSLP